MNRSQKQVLLFFFLSLLIHFLFLGIGALFHRRMDMAKKSEPVQITLSNQPYQIADIEPPAKEERPDKAKFAGMYDSRVEEEKVSQSSPGVHKRAGVSAPEEATEKSVKKSKKEGEGPQVAMNPPEKKPMPRGDGDTTLEALPGDFYPDYKVGDRTYLNVLKFPRVGYFVRLKKIFKTTFNPVPAIRTAYMSNQISKGQVEVTLGISLDRSGGLSELFVINSSGIEAYDQEALRTIKDSSPFSVPPSELLDASSSLRMVWTFTVYL